MDNNTNPNANSQPAQGTNPNPPAAQPLPNVQQAPTAQPLPTVPTAPTAQPVGYAPSQYPAPPSYAPANYAPASYAPAQYAAPQYAPVPTPYSAQGQATQGQAQVPTQPGYANVPQQPVGPQYQKIDKRILNACRHKSELRWYWFLVILNLVIIVGAVCYFFYAMDENQEYVDNVYTAYSEYVEDTMSGETADSSDDQKADNQKDDTEKDDEESTDSMDNLSEKINDMPESIEYLAMILFLLVAIPFIVSYAYAQYRSMSIQITEKTYPEIYAIVQEYSQKLGLKKVPKVYMIQGNGVLNAFSSFIPFKQYIELYADLVEVAYREHHDMDTLRFIIAHEMGHIYYKHATMHYYYSMLVSQTIPILGSTASRAREYSCDRLAQLLSGSDGIDAMMSLTAGIHLYKQVDKQDYINHTTEVKGLFVFCYNLVCDHPVTSKRVIALADPQRRSGKLY